MIGTELDARIRLARRRVHEVLRGHRPRCVTGRPAHGIRELAQTPRDEAVLERRHERDPDHGEGREDDGCEREAESRTDAAEADHERKR